MDWSKEFAISVENGELPRKLIEQFLGGESFCGSEGVCWDFKRDSLVDDPIKFADTVKDIVAFYNTFGGFLIFGIDEVEKDTRFRVVGIQGTPINIQKLKGLISAYTKVDIGISYGELSIKEAKIAVLHIPKRPASTSPVRFVVRGPEKKSKPIFEQEQVAFRRGDSTRIAQHVDDWQTLLGSRSLDLLGLDLGRIRPSATDTVRLPHNLPIRSAICANFIGRTDVLSSLWEWLNDEFQYAKVIAGDGGKGKTSIAYEFCTQVSASAPLQLERIVWLTAKKNQFSGYANAWIAMPDTHFFDFRTLLAVLGENIGYTSDEMEAVSEQEMQRLIRSHINIQRTLFVIDDLDSLTKDDQKRILEFCARIGASGVRFLLTTRSNASYSTELCITLRGMEGKDYEALVRLLVGKYGINLPKGAEDILHGASDGSPLLTDSILRLVRRGTDFHKAISDWKGAAGEDARKAVLQKEIEQLTPEARRLLLAIAFFGECSLAEVKSVVMLADIKLQDSLDELQSLFLVDSPKIIESEPRFEINNTAANLVIAQKSVLAHDFVKIESGVKAVRSSARKEGGKGNNPEVGRAISQAIALSKGGDLAAAVETIDAALRRQKRHPDLLVARAFFRINTKPMPLEEIRKDLRLAYEEGGRKERLFELWYQAERLAEFGYGLIEVAEKAVKEFPEDFQLWAKRKAEGYLLIGLIRSKSGDFDAAISELMNAANELYLSIRDESDDEKLSDDLDYLFGVHDRIVRFMTSAPGKNIGNYLEIFRGMLERADFRTKTVSLAFDSLKTRMTNESRKGKLADSPREWLLSERRWFVTALQRAAKDERWVEAEKFARVFEALRIG